MMLKTQRVTIAIALCNNENYIERCMQSVSDQTYSDTEIIIVDDGSKDGSLKKCEKYRETDNVLIIAKENGGLSSARQAALEKSTGEYICFIDADDYLKKTYVEKLMEKITNANADICVCSTEFVDESGNIIPTGTAAYKTSNTICDLKNSNLGEYFETASAAFLLSDSWNKMYKTEFLRKGGVRFELPKGFNGTDLAFNHKLYLHRPVYCSVDSAEYVHVIYSKSATHRKRKKLQEGSMCIVTQLMHESEITNNGEFAENVLPSIYVRLMRKSFQDVFCETVGNKKELNEELKLMLKKHKEFVSESGLNIKCRKIGSLQLRVFAAALMHFNVLLKPYLFLRMKYSGSDA